MFQFFRNLFRGFFRGIRRAYMTYANWFWSRLTRRAEFYEQKLIVNLKRENNRLKSDNELKGREIRQLIEVNARDRERVAAETAILSRRKQEAESGPNVQAGGGPYGEI